MAKEQLSNDLLRYGKSLVDEEFVSKHGFHRIRVIKSDNGKLFTHIMLNGKVLDIIDMCKEACYA